MAIKISQGFKRTSKDPIDETLALTKAQMKSVDEASLPDKYFTICQDDGKLYLYNKDNTVDETTGKFRLQEGGGLSEVPTLDEVVGAGRVIDDKVILGKRGTIASTSYDDYTLDPQLITFERGRDNTKNLSTYSARYINMTTQDTTNDPATLVDEFKFNLVGGNNNKPIVTMSADVKQAWVDALDLGGGGGYVLPIASGSTLGGVKVGENLTIDNNGMLSANQFVGFNAGQDYSYSDIARACRRNLVFVTDGADKRKPVVFFELDDNNREATLYTAEKNGFTAYKWNSTEYVGKTTLTTIPNGGTTGQVLAKKSDTDQDFDWETIVSDGWGVAKIGSVSLTSTGGSHIPFQIIDITNLNLESVNDYEVFVTIEDNRSTAYKVDNAFANKISTTQFEVGFYTSSQEGLTVNLSYVVIAKGFQSIMGGESGVPSGGTTGQVLAKKSDADKDVEWKTVEGTGIVDTEMSSSSVNAVQNKVIKDYVDSKEPDAITNQEIDTIIFG